MKLKLSSFILTAALCGLMGCGYMRNVSKHFHSAVTGLDRKITLYNANGGVIKEWRTRAQIEDKGGTVHFIVNGKAVTVAGTFTIEEQ